MQPVTVVTGANSGIGRATAIHLAANGHRVFGTVRSLDKAGKMQEMAAKAGAEAELVVLDVADDDSSHPAGTRSWNAPDASTISSTTRASAATP